MTLRKVVFWLHLAAGIFAGVVILIMSVTGVALTYQKQMTEWADRAYWPAPAADRSEKLPIEALISRAAAARPDAAPAAVTFYADPGAPAVVAIGGGRNVFIDRYTGAVGGEGSQAIRAFFRLMTDWHRYMGAGGDSRAFGKAITGACNLAFLFIVVSGIYLWFPRRWNWPAVRSVTWFRRGLSGKARDFNWHSTFGFWTALPLFLVVISATVISYPSATNLVYRLAGSGPPAPAARTAAATEGAVLDAAGLDWMIARVEEQTSGWRTINMRLPASADSEVTLTIDRGWGGQPQLRSTLVLNRASGETLRVQGFENQSAGQRARSWLRFVHTGEFYGLAGQTIAGVASAAGAVLVWTGLALTSRRFVAWIGRRKRPAAFTPAPVGRPGG